AGTARPVVLDAIAREHLDTAVIHPHGNLDLHLAEGGHEDAAHVAFQTDEIGGAVELARNDGLPRHRAAGSGGGSHGTPQPGSAAASKAVRATSGALSPSARVRQAGSAGPSVTTWPNCQRESRARSTKAATSAASSGTSEPVSAASTTVPVSANQRSAGERCSGRRGA